MVAHERNQNPEESAPEPQRRAKQDDGDSLERDEEQVVNPSFYENQN